MLGIIWIMNEVRMEYSNIIHCIKSYIRLIKCKDKQYALLSDTYKKSYLIAFPPHTAYST